MRLGCVAWGEELRPSAPQRSHSFRKEKHTRLHPGHGQSPWSREKQQKQSQQRKPRRQTRKTGVRPARGAAAQRGLERSRRRNPARASRAGGPPPAAPLPRPQLRDFPSSGARIRGPPADPTPRRYPRSPPRIRSMSRSSSPPSAPPGASSAPPRLGPRSRSPPALRLWGTERGGRQRERGRRRVGTRWEKRGRSGSKGKAGRRGHRAVLRRCAPLGGGAEVGAAGGGAAVRDGLRQGGDGPLRTRNGQRLTWWCATKRESERFGGCLTTTGAVYRKKECAVPERGEVGIGRGAPIAPARRCRASAPPPPRAAARASAPSCASSRRRRPPRPPGPPAAFSGAAGGRDCQHRACALGESGRNGKLHSNAARGDRETSALGMGLEATRDPAPLVAAPRRRRRPPRPEERRCRRPA